MCNSNGDDGHNFLEPRTEILKTGTQCRKCKEQTAQIILQIRDAYCRDCFLTSCHHKFRAILGKSRVLHGTLQPVLIAFSGSGSSIALLSLVAYGVGLGVEPGRSHKRLMAQPNLLYIDEGIVTGEDLATRLNRYHAIHNLVKAYGFPLYFLPLTLEKIPPSTEQVIKTQGDDNMQQMFASMPDLTSKLDLLQRLRQRVLVYAANYLDIQKVLLADDATSLAVKILSNVSIGRGAHIPLETGFLDTRDDPVVFIRPMKDFTSKEIAFYNKFMNLEPVVIPSLLTKTSVDESIQRLTEEFVVSLQNEFPSTVSTIYRTGDKLSVPYDGDMKCALCRGPLDTSDRDCCAMDATEYSRKLSTGLTEKSCCQSQCGCGKSKSTLKFEDLQSELCYACRLLARNMTSLEALPADVLSNIRERTSFKQMENQIREFLLE